MGGSLPRKLDNMTVATRRLRTMKKGPLSSGGRMAPNVRLWAGAARAGSQIQGATADGAIRAAYGRFRSERSFPPADGNGLSWSGAVGAEFRILVVSCLCDATVRVVRKPTL
jgi:hypothetical protein